MEELVYKLEVDDLLALGTVLRELRDNYPWLIFINPKKKQFSIRTDDTTYVSVLTRLGAKLADLEEDKATNSHVVKFDDMTFRRELSNSSNGFSAEAMKEVIDICAKVAQYQIAFAFKEGQAAVAFFE